MSKILIVGDSNGLGEWGTIVPGPSVANGTEIFRPWNKELYLKEPHSKPFNVVWPGFGYYLDQKGHATVNYSIGGGCNIEALFKTTTLLLLPYDLLIFFAVTKGLIFLTKLDSLIIP